MPDTKLPSANTVQTASIPGWIKHLPNILTIIRLTLAIPIGLLIVREDYVAVLWIAFFAGLSDGVDGWIARRFNATSRLGSILDPLADKALMLATFVGLAMVHLIPWWLAALVIGRDLLIVGGVILYRGLTHRIDMEPSLLSKFNTALQIAYSLTLLLQQVWPVIPQAWFNTCVWLLALLAVATAADYITKGIQKTRQYNDSPPRTGS